MAFPTQSILNTTSTSMMFSNTTKFTRFESLSTLRNLVLHNPTSEMSYVAIAVCSVAFILNSVEIALLRRTRKKMTIFEIWLCSLALADLIVSISIIIFEAIRMNVKGNIKVLTAFVILIAHFTVFASSATIMLISIDRLMAIKYPLKHRLWMTKKKAVIINVVVWALNLSYSLIEAITNRFSAEIGNFSSRGIFRQIDAYVILLMAIIFIFAYSLIIYESIVKFKSPISKGKLNNVVVVATCILVVTSYIICMLPYAISFVKKASLNLSDFRVILVYVNSALNPVVYFFKRYLTMILQRRKAKKRSKEQTNPSGQTSKSTDSKTDVTQL